MAAKRIRGIEGEIPIVYTRETIFVLATVINSLVRQVNELSQTVERLETQLKEGK